MELQVASLEILWEKPMVNLAFSEPSQDEQEQKHFEFLNMAYHSSTIVFRHSSRHELIEATSLKCTHRTISNYLELCSNYVAGSVFFSKKWSSVSQDWPCFEGPASAIRKGEWEVGVRYQKKVGLPSAGPRPFTRTLEKPRRDMLNKRELVKLDVEVARLKARLGQTDGLLGTLLIANPSAAWAHDFQIRNEKRIAQSFRNVLLLHFPNIFSD